MENPNLWFGRGFHYMMLGPICRIIGIMDQFVYINILENVRLPFAEEMLLNGSLCMEMTQNIEVKMWSNWWVNIKWGFSTSSANPRLHSIWELMGGGEKSCFQHNDKSWWTPYPNVEILCTRMVATLLIIKCISVIFIEKDNNNGNQMHHG